MATNLSIGILGFGKMGMIRYQTLSEFDGCKVCAIYDPDSDAIPQKLQVDSPTDILKAAGIDCVVISVPNYLMREYICTALANGKHVFCEKPPGRNLAETREIASVARASDRKLMFGFNHRHHDSVEFAKELIDTKKYGDVLWMRGRYGKSVSPSFNSNWRSDPKKAGGGIFLDQGIHMLDLFMNVLGPFEEVKSFVSNLYWKGGVEDNVFALFRNKRGQVASLHSTMTQWRHLFSWEIFLESGYIVLNGLKTSSNTYGRELLSFTKDRTTSPAATWSEEETLSFEVDTSWRKELANFIEAIVKDLPITSCGIDDALELMTMVDKVYSSSEPKL